MNVIQKIKDAKPLDVKAEQRNTEVKELKRMYTELSQKSAVSNNQFKLITGSALTPTPTSSRPSMEQMLTDAFCGNTISHSIITKVSQVASQIQWKAEVSTDGGVTWENEDGVLQASIDKPNSGMTANEFRVNAMIYLMATGNVFFTDKEEGDSIVKFKSDSEGIGDVHLLPSNLIQIRLNADNTIRQFDYNKNGCGIQDKFNPEEIAHLKFIDPSLIGHRSHLGISPLLACWNVVKASNNLTEADASMLQNKGVLGVMSNKNEVLGMSEPERQRMQDSTDELLGGASNFAKTLVSAVPIEYTSIGMTSADLQMIEGGVFKDRQICTAFGVSALSFNDLVASTMDNMKVATKKLYTDSAIPNNDVLIRLYSQFLIPKLEAKEPSKKFRVVQVTEDIEALQPDKKLKADTSSVNTSTILSIAGSNLPEAMKVKMISDIAEIDESDVEEYMKEMKPEPEPPEPTDDEGEPTDEPIE